MVIYRMIFGEIQKGRCLFNRQGMTCTFIPKIALFDLCHYSFSRICTYDPVTDPHFEDRMQNCMHIIYCKRFYSTLIDQMIIKVLDVRICDVLQESSPD